MDSVEEAMIYTPEKFKLVQADPRIGQLIQTNPLATLISVTSNASAQLMVSHLPLILKTETTLSGDDESIVRMQLVGHMAKANPHWRLFVGNSDSKSCRVIFHGPDTYVTPKWYRSGRDVPTWNYAVVHMEGQLELKPQFADQKKILAELVEHFEKGEPAPWAFQLPDDLEQPSALEEAIISFVIHVEKVEAKFKLSQNRKMVDQEGILAGLAERRDEKSRTILEMMRSLVRG